MVINTTINLSHYKKKKDSTHSVQLLVYYEQGGNTVSRPFKLEFKNSSINLTKEQFEKLKSKKPGSLKDLKLHISAEEKRAKEIIKGLDPFSFESFKLSFYNKWTELNDVFFWFEKIANDPSTSEGNAANFRTAANSFRTVLRRSKLDFSEVTPKLLKEYEKRMNRANKKENTISIYVRALRRVFNVAGKEIKIILPLIASLLFKLNPKIQAQFCLNLQQGIWINFVFTRKGNHFRLYLMIL